MRYLSPLVVRFASFQFVQIFEAGNCLTREQSADLGPWWRRSHSERRWYRVVPGKYVCEINGEPAIFDFNQMSADPECRAPRPDRTVKGLIQPSRRPVGVGQVWRPLLGSAARANRRFSGGSASRRRFSCVPPIRSEPVESSSMQTLAEAIEACRKIQVISPRSNGGSRDLWSPRSSPGGNIPHVEVGRALANVCQGPAGRPRARVFRRADLR